MHASRTVSNEPRIRRFHCIKKLLSLTKVNIILPFEKGMDNVVWHVGWVGQLELEVEPFPELISQSTLIWATFLSVVRISLQAFHKDVSSPR